MKSTFALLTNNQIHNLVRKLSWDIHRKYRTGIDICRIPPHISLKQPFEISDLDRLGKYMSEFAASIAPFEVKLTELQLIEVNKEGFETGILWMDVEETQTLRQLHDRLNEELAVRFGNVQAPYDGLQYHFHMTVARGNQPVETYRRIKKEFSNRLTNLRYTIQELAMFGYDDTNSMAGGYMTYMILSLGKGPSESGSST